MEEKMWHKSKPLFSDSAGRAEKKQNRPIFCTAHGITKKPSDVNDVSTSKDIYLVKQTKLILSEEESKSIIKNAKQIKSKSGKVDENKWMHTMMKRAGQL